MHLCMVFFESENTNELPFPGINLSPLAEFQFRSVYPPNIWLCSDLIMEMVFPLLSHLE